MPRPTARVLALLELLQAGGTRTAAQLAERLGVDERTVRRYVDHLLELEVPVDTVRGRYGGYRIAAGHRLPPLMFTEAEAVATSLGLAAAARSGPSEEVRVSAETAFAKLHRVLPTRSAERLRALLEVRSTQQTPPRVEVPSAVLLTAAEAARDRRPLRIRHLGRSGQPTERAVLPWGVVEHRSRWYLVGPDSATDKVRTFRLDRIAAAEFGPGRFDVPNAFDPEAHLLTALARVPREHEVQVLVRAGLDRVRAQLPEGVAVLTVEPDADGVRVELRAQNLGWVAGILAMLDAPFRIERPEALRTEVLALASRLRSRANDPGSTDARRPTAAPRPRATF
ncbi:helix-turn-helix transcriptional regulator [Glaciibacter flavus]|uniref:helix-turn-helix transcriptional regulator n=1 Tax=Orlajensenia flava TaxID=2565934 RepID=UPI003B0026EB